MQCNDVGGKGREGICAAEGEDALHAYANAVAYNVVAQPWKEGSEPPEETEASIEGNQSCPTMAKSFDIDCTVVKFLKVLEPRYGIVYTMHTPRSVAK